MLGSEIRKDPASAKGRPDQMTLKKLIVSNFRSFNAVQKFAFANGGFYLVTGRNELRPQLGANDVGKSTLWDALCWVLFGCTSRGVRGPNVVSWHAKTCVVGLSFEHDNKLHKLKRSQRPNALKLQIDDDEWHDVTQEQIDALLGFDCNAFLSSVLISQFGITFFDLGPSGKLAAFSAALGLEFWVDKSEKARRLARDLDNEVYQCTNTKRHLEGQQRAFMTVRDQAKHDADAWQKTQRERNKQAKQDRDALRVVLQTKLMLARDAERKLNDAKAAYEVCRKRALAMQGVRSVETVRREIDAVKRSVCPTCGQPLHEQKRESELHKLKRELEDAENVDTVRGEAQSADALRIESSKTFFDCDREYNVVKLKLDAAEKALNSVNDSVCDADTRYKDAVYNLKAISASIKTESNNIIAAETKRDAALQWSGLFKELRLWLVEQALVELQTTVQNALNALGLGAWQITFDIERENASGTVTKGFTVNVRAPDADQSTPWELWGGGVTQRLRIAGAAGLSDLIRASRPGMPNIEIWDEPTQHLGVEGINDLLTYFSERARNEQRALYLIDHRSLSSGDFDDRICIVKTSQGSQIGNDQ